MIKKTTILTVLIVLGITILGGILRFYKITQNPPSLTGDEISFGYSAYSVLRTGKDEHGKYLPLTFESVGDFKNPLPAYLMVPSIKLFGLTDFAVRLPNALMGTLSIPIFFLFLLDIFKKKKVAYIGSFFLAISAWHVFYSRFAYETLMASLFILLGIWFFIKMLRGKAFWGVLSAFFFTLTMYTAFAPRLFIPAFLLVTILLYLPKLKTRWGGILLFAATCVILGLPLIYVTLFQGAGTRLEMVFISNDIEFSRNVILKGFNSVADVPQLFFFWVKRYLSYFDPGFIFFNGLDATIPNKIGLGLLYLFDLPLLVLGVVSFIKNKFPDKKLLSVWIFTGLLPDSLTNNQKHAGRLLHLLPIMLILTTFGAIELYGYIKKIKGGLIRLTVYLSLTLVIFISLVHSFLIISVNFPRDKGESFDEGWREAVYYVMEHQDKYNEIVFDPRRGVAAPDMVSNPFLYVLFYTKYDPLRYQTEEKIFGGTPEDNYYKFGKYVFRHINWQADRDNRGTLFVGSPWSIPKKDMREGWLFKTIHLSSGEEAFYIVSPN